MKDNINNSVMKWDEHQNKTPNFEIILKKKEKNLDLDILT